MHRCVDGALDSGLRIDADDLQRRELGQGLQRDLEQLVRAEAAASVDVRAARARGVVQGVRAGAGRRRQRQDRPRRRRPAQRPRDRRRLQVGRGAVGDADPRRGAPADPALPARAARSARPGADGRRLHAARRRPPRRAGCSARATTRCRASRAADYLDGPEFEAEIEHARETARSCWPSGSGPATCCTTRTAATAPAGATSGGCAARSGREARAVARRRAAGPKHAQPAAAGRDRRARLDVRLRGRRHRQDDRARRALRARR